MWITEPGRGALSNNVLASRPHHPYWQRLTQSLMPWDRGYLFPYVTISYASGQWFVTAIWNEYHRLLPAADPARPELEHRLHRLMMDDRPEADPILFFTQERGGSWINWDNRMFLVIGDHLLLFFTGLFALIGATGFVALRCVRRYRRGYARIKNEP